MYRFSLNTVCLQKSLFRIKTCIFCQIIYMLSNVLSVLIIISSCKWQAAIGAVCSIKNHYLMMVKQGRDLFTCDFMNVHTHTHTNLVAPASTTVTVFQFLFVALVVVDR